MTQFREEYDNFKNCRCCFNELEPSSHQRTWRISSRPLGYRRFPTSGNTNDKGAVAVSKTQTTPIGRFGIEPVGERGP